MTGVLSLKPEVSALGSSTLSGALLSSRPPEHEDPIGMFLPTTTRLCTRPALHQLTSSGRSSEWIRFREV